MLFRLHRGSLDNSMKTVKEVETLSDIIKYLKEDGLIDVKSLTCKFYCFDERINWNTYIICSKGQAVGFSNGMIY